MTIPISYKADRKDLSDLKNFLKKIRYKIIPLTFNVAFSIKSREGFNSGFYYNQILKNYSNLIEDNKLTNVIKIKNLKDIIDFDNNKSAEKYVVSQDLDLLIWGNFTEDNLKIDGKGYNEINLKFTYPCPKDRENKIKELMNLEFHNVLLKNNYNKILEDNSFNDVKIIADNIFFEASYILGKTLFIFFRTEEAETIFTNLLNVTNDEEKTKLIKLNLYFILDILYSKYFYNNRKFIKKIADKANSIFPNDINWMSRLAFIEYKLGNMRESKLISDKSYNLFPNHASAIINNAFFLILSKKYKKAFDEYLRLLHHNLPFSVPEAIICLNDEFERTKDPFFYFASGFLNFNFGDKKIGKDDLNNFIELSNEDDYKNVYRYAKKMIYK